jgi:hypothetical protein
MAQISNWRGHLIEIAESTGGVRAVADRTSDTPTRYDTIRVMSHL